MNDPDLALLIDAAHASGDIARTHWGQNPKVWDKGDGAGPVSEADLEIDRMLSGELRAARPDYGWLSEETEDGCQRLDSERVFIIDPIDGTRAFINSEKTFSHSLAIAEAGKIIAAVVFLPLLNKLYSATASGPSMLNGAAINVSESGLDGADVLGAKSNFDAGLWQGGALPVNRHFRSSLAYRLCLVAEGRFDAMLTLRATWEWDVAAGNLIVAQAGGKVTDLGGGSPLYNNPHPQLSGMIAAGTGLHRALHERLL